MHIFVSKLFSQFKTGSKSNCFFERPEKYFSCHKNKIQLFWLSEPTMTEFELNKMIDFSNSKKLTFLWKRQICKCQKENRFFSKIRIQFRIQLIDFSNYLPVNGFVIFLSIVDDFFKSKSVFLCNWLEQGFPTFS